VPGWRQISPTLALMALMALSLTPCAAVGQISGSLTFESDYRYRGVSYSNERPDLRLTLAYDHASGAYLGASATSVQFPYGEPGPALQAYVGYAGEIDAPWRWEIGATTTHFSKDSDYDYAEAFIGILGDHGSVRLYMTPDYYGIGAHTRYLEFSGGWPLSPELRLFALGGVLHRSGTRGVHLDARIGAAWQTGNIEWQLAWLTAQRSAPFGVPRSQARSLLWLGTRWSF
jgi:uncharacterized protein (TIGR02001 family)